MIHCYGPEKDPHTGVLECADGKEYPGPDECEACRIQQEDHNDYLADLAFDAARESRYFGGGHHRD